MKVSELIEMLKAMPQELEVIDSSYGRVSGCHVNQEYYDGDSANPKCKVIKVVEIE